MSNKKQNPIMTSANIVTIVRICFVPVFVAAFLSPWPSLFPNIPVLEQLKPWIALIIFCLLAATDSLDGYLARSRGEVTDFGKFLDPLADKILVAAALIALVELGSLPSWVVLLILMREFIVSGLRMLSASKGVVIAASWYGKAKTVFQILAIIMFIIKDALSDMGTQQMSHPLYIASWVVMLVAIALTLVSMFDYIFKCKDILGFGNSDKPSSPVDVEEQNIDLAKKIVDIATAKNITIGCCESLTCGMICSCIGSVPGASKVFVGGLSTYSYAVKSGLLDIDMDYLLQNGAVNEKTAKQMAISSKNILKCDISVSATGVAGPDKDEAGNDVGTVFIGISSNTNNDVQKHNFDGDRKMIRLLSTNAALTAILSNL